MLISNSQEFIFLHIPKTAGTSIVVSLAQSLKWNDLVIGGTEFGESIQPYYKNMFGLSKHSSACEIKSVIGAKIWSRYLKFAFVRHPYTRAISLYTYVQKVIGVRNLKGHIRFFLGKTRVQSWQLAQAYLETNNFSEFIRHEKFIKSFITTSQTEYLVDETGKTDVNFIGKFEKLRKDFSSIADKAGLENLILGKNNVTSKKVKKPLLNERDYTYLNRLYLRDFDNFSYDPKLRI